MSVTCSYSNRIRSGLLHQWETLASSLDDDTDTDQDSASASDSSDDESCCCSKIKKKYIIKVQLFVESTVPRYSDKAFQSHFRMNKALVYRFIDRLQQSGFINNQNNGEEVITSEKAFLITLWYVANTESFRQVSDRFNVSNSSAHRTVSKVFDFLLSICSEVIKWPGRDESDNISNQFAKKQGIRNVFGAIDGCHVKIPRPKNDQDSYCNRKGFHSLLIQGVVDHRKLFIDVYSGEPGSIHDARLLRKSSIYSRAEENRDLLYNKFLLGDSAYPAMDWLVTPFKDNGSLTRLQRSFNFKHSSSRIVVEHAFGLLKGRFRRLHRLKNISLKFSSKCIMACCILHNICILEKGRYSDCNCRHCRRLTK